MSQDYPAQFGRSPFYRDPQQTLPMPPPAAGTMPAAQWYTQWQNFRWSLVRTIDVGDADPLGVGFVYGYTWTSPAFDLRPDLRSGNAGTKDGVPIWSMGGRLFVQLATPGAGGIFDSVRFLSTEAQEWVNTTVNRSGDTNVLDGATAGAGLLREALYDVSAQFSSSGGGSANTILAGFAPPGTSLGGGEGYPVRYWRLQLKFSVFVETDAPLPDPATVTPPALLLQASVY